MWFRAFLQLVAVWSAPWSPAGPRKSLDTRGVLLFVGALLSWRPVLANRRILMVIGGGLVCSVVAGGAQKIAGYQGCFALRWCTAFLAACARKGVRDRRSARRQITTSIRRFLGSAVAPKRFRNGSETTSARAEVKRPILKKLTISLRRNDQVGELVWTPPVVCLKQTIKQ